MQPGTRYTVVIALIVALGGFLMGFDAAVIAGAVGAIEVEFELTKIQLGWSVSSLSLTATMGMLLSTRASGPCFISPARMPSECTSATSLTFKAASRAVA